MHPSQPLVRRSAAATSMRALATAGVLPAASALRVSLDRVHRPPKLRPKPKEKSGEAGASTYLGQGQGERRREGQCWG